MPVTSYSQLGEDLQIAYFLNRREDLTYIDVGALWPVELSNTYFFYKRGGWGLCIEPNPNIASVFQNGRSRDIFVSCGAGEEEGELEYTMHENPVFNTVSPERAAEIQRKSAGRSGRRVTDVMLIPIRTLDQIVRETGFADRTGDRIDFLTIDASGHELEVVNGFSFESPRPSLVVCGHQSKFGDFTELVELMDERGYRQTGSTRNTLYFTDSNI